LAFKVIEFDANREPVYDFLLVINRPYLVWRTDGQTDRQTDRRTDRIAMARTRWKQ